MDLPDLEMGVLAPDMVVKTEGIGGRVSRTRAYIYRTKITNPVNYQPGRFVQSEGDLQAGACRRKLSWDSRPSSISSVLDGDRILPYS